MHKPTLLISIETEVDTKTITFGRQFIQSLCDEDARLIPQFVSLDENYKEPFFGLEDFLTNWWAVPQTMYLDNKWVSDSHDGPYWKRKSTLVSRGTVDHGFLGRSNVYMPSALWFESRWAKNVDFFHLFKAWVSLSQPEIAMMHVFTEPEIQSSNQGGNRSFSLGLFGNGTGRGLHNVGWAMAYGKNYAHEVDFDRISDAGFPIFQLGGTTVVQITEQPSDVINDFDRFSRRRAELKAFFRKDFFTIKEEPKVIRTGYADGPKT